jgi:predicted RNA binding protein YcfA (HicA-like mRNA interferase family)
MTKKEKRLQRFLISPESFKYKEIELLLLSLGFQKIDAKGSHIKLKHYKLDSDIIVPIHNQDCKNFYKKQIQKVLFKSKIV